MFNFETIEINNKPQILCFSYSCNNVYHNIWYDEFKNKEFIFNFLEKLNSNTYYYTHNLLYNFLLIIKSLIKFQISYKWIFIDYKLYEVIIFFKNKKIYLRCSHKLLPFSMSKFFPIFTNIQKMYTPNELLEYWEPNTLCTNIKNINIIYKNLNYKQYLDIITKNNLSLLHESILNFIQNLTHLNITFSKKNLSCSSIAFNFYLKRFNKINFDLPKNQKNIFEQAYFGGKCEVYGNQKLNEKVLHFDFSGMYYNCMKEVLPFGEFKFKDTNFNLEEYGFYYIDINYKNKYPILPIKEDKLYFKEGRISGWFWSEEISLTLKNSHIYSFSIKYAFISLSNDNILYEFLEHLNKFKDDFTIKKQIGKLLINSFYGRLALKDEINIMSLVEHLENNKCYGIVDDLFLIKKKSHKIPKSNLAMAAAIASKARIKLYKAQLEVIKNGGRILYSDTDSVFAAFDNSLNIENKLLGEYVLFDTNKNDTVIIDSVFISSKTYAVKFNNNIDVVKIKGINTSVINFYDLKNKFFSNQKYLDINTHQLSKKNLSLKYITYNKNISLQDYNKRVWVDNKYDTIPLQNN